MFSNISDRVSKVIYVQFATPVGLVAVATVVPRCSITYRDLSLTQREMLFVILFFLS